MGGSSFRRSFLLLGVMVALILGASAAMHDRKHKSRKLSVTGQGDASKFDSLVNNLAKLPRKAQGEGDWDYDDSSSSDYDEEEGNEESVVVEKDIKAEDEKDNEEKKLEDEKEFPSDPWAESTNGIDPIAPLSNTTVVNTTESALDTTIGSVASNTSVVSPLNGSVNATMFGMDVEKEDFEGELFKDGENGKDDTADSMKASEPLDVSSNVTAINDTQAVDEVIGSATSNASVIDPVVGSENANATAPVEIEVVDVSNSSTNATVASIVPDVTEEKDQTTAISEEAMEENSEITPGAESNSSSIPSVEKEESDTVVDVVDGSNSTEIADVMDVSNSTDTLVPIEGNSTTEGEVLPEVVDNDNSTSNGSSHSYSNDTEAGATIVDEAVPVDCVVSEWKVSKACPLGCGLVGKLEEVREIVTPAENGGDECPKLEQVIFFWFRYKNRRSFPAFKIKLFSLPALTKPKKSPQ